MKARHNERTAARWVTRVLIVCMASALLLSGGCKTKRVVTLRISSTHVNLLYYSRGRVLFEPIDGTSFRSTGGGQWAGGDVTYSITDEGNFEIVMDGQWMQDEVLRNREGAYPGAYVLEIPLVGIEDDGTFEVSVEYAYEDLEDGTGWRVVADGRIYPSLELPLEGSDDYIGIVMQCSDPQGEACSVTRPDPDGVEVPDIPDVPDATVEPDLVDDVEDAVGDPVEDPAPEPSDDIEADDSGD
ncbi:MAG: hypothetical protein JRG91_04795 [Deltaproteobacteria bacterium]|nr:hypothetical protein [Deltaproteobacteria bacterium]